MAMAEARCISGSKATKRRATKVRAPRVRSPWAVSIEICGSVFPLGLSPAAVAGEVDFFFAGQDFGELEATGSPRAR